MDERRSVSVLWAVLAVLLGIFSGWQVYTDSEQAECQAQYNLAFTEQLRIRSNLAVASDQAQSALLLGVSRLVAQPASDNPKIQSARAAEFRQLFTTFDEAVVKAEKSRQETPLPPIPDCAKS